MKKSVATAGFLLGLIALTSCGTNPQAPVTSDDPKSQAEQAALKYQAGTEEDKCRLDASKTGTKLDECLAKAAGVGTKESYVQEPEVIESETWRAGYGVSVRYQKAEGPEVTWIYGMEQVDGQWKMTEYNQLESKDATDPQRVCKTLGTC
ncbi:hypothetical protein [Pseudarthrobacter sp. J47]|uniref:hypothetical protein n=1 Tax=Pseudarthrobacter sp. J47 TaxID=3116482 RepID=UPI002E7FE975|nr:hypothetical protein [Pseudarthrobacter sp. J47]MEE2524541.1 hypothetical protein [Pseudarthrobacter sp. J47]